MSDICLYEVLPLSFKCYVLNPISLEYVLNQINAIELNLLYFPLNCHEVEV